MSRIDTSVVYEGRSHPVSFASDDSIDVVRQRVAAAIDRVPDRVFLQVEVTLPKDYYKDPRRWEALFFRLAHQSAATQTVGKLMDVYTRGRMETGVSRIDWDGSGTEWMRVREDAFPELFILGVEESQSLVLPVPPDTTIAVAVPPARIPLPESSRLFSSVHPHPIRRFVATETPDSADAAVKAVYAPGLRTGTPDHLPADLVKQLDAQFQLWSKLQELPSPKPTQVALTRIRWNIPWVHTHWSDAVRAQFEDILYGTTVSEEVPYIGLFQTRDTAMQHKFYAVRRSNHLDMPTWSAWIQATRPQRNRPTLLFYRGKDRQNFDRIAVTSVGMTVSVYRSGSSGASLDTIQGTLAEWIHQLDGLMAFVNQDDLETWELQDISAELTYKDPMEDPNLRRLPCVSSFFIANHPTYRILRADKTDRSLSDVDVGILQMLRRDIATTSEQLADALGLTTEDAARRLTELRERVEADPSLLTQELDVMPKVELGTTKVSLQHAKDLERLVTYTSILRFILTAKDSQVEDVCPARREAVPAVAAVAPAVAPVEAPAVAPDEIEGDLADFLDQMGSARSGGANPLFNYYTTRLRKVDPDTFDVPYSKKCEPARQVLLLTSEEQAKWKDTPYDPQAYPDTEKLTIPSGVAVCPDYWCMRDEVPLRADQLNDGRCPICNGKVREPKSTETVAEAPVIQRDTQYKYPRLLKDVVSAKNGQGMPCCYKQAKAAQVLPGPAAQAEAPADPFYVLGEAKKLPPTRLAYLPDELARRLRLNIGNYKTIRSESNRLKDRAQGVFRVGLGRPSKTLAAILGVEIPRPRDAIAKLFQCKFVRTWRDPKEDDGTFDAALVAYLPDAQARARMARLMSGVDAAYTAGSLTPLQELEYVGLVTGTPIYRIDVGTSTVTCGFWTQYFGPGRKAIAVLETDSSVDLLAFATHRTDLVWNANLYAAPFPPQTIQILRQADGKACATPLPGSQHALNAAMRIGAQASFPVVVDPTGYVQAIWAPRRYILPMRPELAFDGSMRRVDYADMPDTDLPPYTSQRAALDTAATVHPGYGWRRDVFNTEGARVEIELQCGLRVPVVPETLETSEPAADMIPTLRKGREVELVDGAPNAKDVHEAAEISYSAEVLEFLLFSLSRDLQKDDYRDLRTAIASGDWDEMEGPLEEWYDETVVGTQLDNPAQFVTKVRTPCGQFKKQTQCKGVCGWKDGVCKVQVESRPAKQGQKSEASLLFARLVDTLARNAKKRAMVLDGRASPFFSTILYLELPHERFMTDAQIKWEKTQTTE